MLRKIPLLFLLLFTWICVVYHLGTAPELALSPNDTDERSQWLPKDQSKDYGINHLILFGSPLQRGNFAGKATQKILYRQEAELQSMLTTLLPREIYRQALYFFSMRWFWGIEKFLEPWMLEEMWGVAQSTSKEFNYIASPHTRQIAYHGLHEVGQSFVDINTESAGCTVFAIPQANQKWVIGRNFDFEGGGVFDQEKIMKWVFPSDGYAYVSIIWAGMVGAVTGVNERGVYISINAAGSEDFKRLGTPSTLVLAQALQYAGNAEEAKSIIEKAQVFISDIYVVADNKSTTLYRIEKSPKKYASLSENKATVITNHMISPIWSGDRINSFRREKLTSTAREKRGFELIQGLSKFDNPELVILEFLRDKKHPRGESLPLGNRSAIDALIATHAVIWNAESNRLSVSVGPSLTGELYTYDLRQSFGERKPVFVSALPADSGTDKSSYLRLHELRNELGRLSNMVKKDDFRAAKAQFLVVESLKMENDNYYSVTGDYFDLMGEKKKAQDHWQKALVLHPAYAREREYLEKRVARP